MLARRRFRSGAEAQGYAVPRVSFGRRLALFFLLIAVVPTVALIGILVFVSHDSQRGKADARIAASLQTAFAVYGDRQSDAAVIAKRLAGDPELAVALRGGHAQIERWTRRAAHEPGVTAVELTLNGAAGAAAGSSDAVAFARVGLTENSVSVGTLRLSTTTADQYVGEVKGLTGREQVLRRGDSVLAATVTPPTKTLGPDESGDLTTQGVDYRGREATLSTESHESLLILGPPESGGLLGVGRPAAAILIWFLVAAIVLAWGLARTLTRLHQRVETQAITDPLTGLWNRRYLAEVLEREVARAVRFGHEVSLIILDVDDFKEINDRLGHLQGDLVLESVGEVVRETTREIDVAARYGGDELALVLFETSRDGAKALGERLAQRMRETDVPKRDGGSMGVTISVGVATLPDAAGDMESLVDAADRALLRAKRAGKNKLRAAPANRRNLVG
jgi:diguanylate cyclase (GGDEF)-like protein